MICPDALPGEAVLCPYMGLGRTESDPGSDLDVAIPEVLSAPVPALHGAAGLRRRRSVEPPGALLIAGSGSARTTQRSGRRLLPDQALHNAGAPIACCFLGGFLGAQFPAGKRRSVNRQPERITACLVSECSGKFLLHSALWMPLPSTLQPSTAKASGNPAMIVGGVSCFWTVLTISSVSHGDTTPTEKMPQRCRSRG